MKVAIVSDSHDNIFYIKKFLEDLKKREVDLIFHLGDIISPFAAKEFLNSGKKIVAIYGNNDGELRGLSSLLDIEKFPRKIEQEGKNIFLYHDPVFDEKNLKGVDFLFYGHTHKTFYKKVENTLILNPGELCGYLAGFSTYVTLDLNNPVPLFHRLSK